MAKNFGNIFATHYVACQAFYRAYFSILLESGNVGGAAVGGLPMTTPGRRMQDAGRRMQGVQQRKQDAGNMLAAKIKRGKKQSSINTG